MTRRLFFDSYALVELSRGNPKYIPYLENSVVITIFNLAEFVYAVLAENGEPMARAVCQKFRECVTEVDGEALLQAMLFRRQHAHRDLSYADCIGYVLAQRQHLPFLTGDKQFRDLPGVEFIPK